MVKLNISYPPYSSSQLLEVDDEKKWRVFLDKRLSEEVPADSLGDEFKGYVLKITGGYDKEGFPMMQGVMLNHRTRLLLDGRTGQYTPKRHGCRKRKSVRGCIIGVDMSCINVTIVKRGPVDLPKLTNKEADRPSVRGPKRADNIRKAWGLGKKEDVRQYVVKRSVPRKNGKKDRIKSPKIQRLITPVTRHRKRHRLNLIKKQKEKSRKDAADYANLLAKIRASKRTALLSKRREAKSKLLSTTAGAKEKKLAEAKGKKLAEAKGKKVDEKKAAVKKAVAKKVPDQKKDEKEKKEVAPKKKDKKNPKLTTKKTAELKKVLTKPKTQAIAKPKTLSERHKLQRKKVYAKNILEKKSAEKKLAEQKAAEKLAAEKKKAEAEAAKKKKGTQQKKPQATQQKPGATQQKPKAVATTTTTKKATATTTAKPTATTKTTTPVSKTEKKTTTTAKKQEPKKTGKK